MKVIWSKRAQHSYREQVVWYEANRGHDFVETFSHNIRNYIEAIQQMPSIGRPIKEENGRTYRSISNHPRCTIFYWYDTKEIHIANLRFAAVKQ